MNKFHAIAAASLLAAGLLTATASMASSFDNKLSSVIAHVKADPNYKAIPINSSAEREWFYGESEALYKKQITREQFLADGEKQFPGYGASFSELADLLTAS
jgi:hypothetical protein